MSALNQAGPLYLDLSPRPNGWTNAYFWHQLILKWEMHGLHFPSCGLDLYPSIRPNRQTNRAGTGLSWTWKVRPFVVSVETHGPRHIRGGVYLKKLSGTFAISRERQGYFCKSISTSYTYPPSPIEAQTAQALASSAAATEQSQGEVSEKLPPFFLYFQIPPPSTQSLWSCALYHF